MAAGVAILVLFFVALVYARWAGSKSTEVSTQVGPNTTTTSQPSPTIIRAIPFRPFTQRSRQRTTKRTTNKTLPSDTILTAILSTGGGLIIVGAFYSRLTTIKLWGAEFDVAPTAQETGSVAKAVSDKNLSTEQTGAVVAKALDFVSLSKLQSGRDQLPDHEIQALVEVAQASEQHPG